MAGNIPNRSCYATSRRPVVDYTLGQLIGCGDMLMCMRIVMWSTYVAGALLAGGCGANSPGIASSSNRSTAPAQSRGSGSVRLYRVPSGSMEPTLPLGSMVAVRRGLPALGNIVIANPPRGYVTEECGSKSYTIKLGGAACDTQIRARSKVEMIRRVVAGPGDEMYVQDGHVYLKTDGSDAFVHENDSYIRVCVHNPECNFPTPIRIPGGYWFLMGDNRGESDDSRYWGPVPTAWIVGVATDLKGLTLH
jgi:signal peptidase I